MNIKPTMANNIDVNTTTLTIIIVFLLKLTNLLNTILNGFISKYKLINAPAPIAIIIPPRVPPNILLSINIHSKSSKVSAYLPSLSFHLNIAKLNAVATIINKYSTIILYLNTIIANANDTKATNRITFGSRTKKLKLMKFLDKYSALYSSELGTTPISFAIKYVVIAIYANKAKAILLINLNILVLMNKKEEVNPLNVLDCNNHCCNHN